MYSTVQTATQISGDYIARGSEKNVSAQFGSDQSYLSNGLGGYWKMDESSWGTPNCSDGVALDSSGNGNNAKARPASSGPTAGATGKFGYSGTFDGIHDVVTTNSSVSISPTSGVTVTGWVKMDNGFTSSTDTDYGIVDKGDYKFYLDTTDGKD